MKNFKTYNLALELYRQSQKLKLPSAVLKDQFERARLSVVLNICEGSGKETRKDKRKFYAIAMGSLREVQALFDILERDDLSQQADILGAHLYKLMMNPGGRH